MNNGKVVVAESIKPELMKMLQEATLKKGGELTFNEVKADLNMPDPNCYAPYFGTFQAAAKKAWSKAQRILATQRETETGKIAGTERKEEMAKRGTGAKKAGRPTKYSDDQIRAMMEEYFKSHGELPGFATFKKEHPDVTIRLDRFREIVHQTDPDVLGWVYEGTSGDGELEASEEPEGSGVVLAPEGLTAGDKAVDSEAASDGVVSESEEPIKVPEEVFEKPKTADPATSAEVADSEEKAVAEAPQGEVVVIDLGAESEGEKSEGSGAILAPEEPTKEDTVGLETADSVSGEDSDGKETPDDEGKPKEVDSAEKPKKADGKTIPALEGFYGYGGVASCCLSGDGYNVNQQYASCGGKRDMTLSLYTIPMLRTIPTAGCGSIHLSVVISCDRNPSAGLQCDGEADACLVMNEAKTTFHISGMGLSEYSLNRNVRRKTTSITVIVTDRSLTIDFNGLAKITREDVTDDVSGEFALAIEATVGAICVYGGCEFEAKSDSTEDPHNA